jgi:hypothetical protein
MGARASVRSGPGVKISSKMMAGMLNKRDRDQATLSLKRLEDE